ncbi:MULTISPECIES: Lrp/AsnC family transcriptional regulator [Thalassobaculum]|uniref:Lrp/AsnC family transcriptional regulator n=1 Tax=Thalassobaculum litoreum DSM 18839 TaxID=1123362 RepID=A0A8G2BGJ2_9PROT|nr:MULTISPECIES: Lrp/AsnC family transcriptional regulator [Thalassobaculum]SDF51936.1 Lrp/AsnC family transcriptional regulator [Thalassobaculum litoreum DSM 18839]
MDDTDRRILRILQADCSAPVSEVARQVGLSASPCWKRINRLQESGVIREQVAVLEPEALGYGLTVFMSISTGEHSGEWLRNFAEFVSAMPEVQEFHRMAGEIDYMLKVVVADMKAFDAFYKRLVDTTPLTEVTSRFSMETIKQTTALPV